MQQAHFALATYMRVNGLTQEALAKAANVSQATVCRALRKAPQRHGKSWRKLFTYAGLLDDNNSWYTGVENASTEAGITRITRAFLDIWDGTETNAVAVANIIQALGALTPERK